MTADDAAEYAAQLVRALAVQHTAAAAAAGQAPGSDATVAGLLNSLVHDLSFRCEAMRQLLATPGGGGFLHGAVQRFLQAAALSRLGDMLQAAAVAMAVQAAGVAP